MTKRFDRFMRRNRIGRGSIPKDIRRDIYLRDGETCQFCGRKPPREDLTIDHLIPLADGGLDEVVNYVTACRDCNQRKADLPLSTFAKSIRVSIEDLPVHGDPIIDNDALPIEIRLLRKRIFDLARNTGRILCGRSAQKKLEKSYRRELWQTELGRRLEAEFPTLPGQVRAIIPEIRGIAKDAHEFLLLVELAKSARTRNLIGTLLTEGDAGLTRLRDYQKKSNDESTKKRIDQAILRFEKACRRHGINPTGFGECSSHCRDDSV